jgi:hypothetical protein
MNLQQAYIEKLAKKSKEQEKSFFEKMQEKNQGGGEKLMRLQMMHNILKGKTASESLEKSAQVELIKWAIANQMTPPMPLAQGGGGALTVPQLPQYFGPKSGPGVIEMGAGGASRLGTVAKFVGGKVLPGVGAIAQGYGAYDRFKNKDYLGAAIDGIGAVGSAAMLAPHPIAKAVGGAVSFGTTALNAYLDNRRAKQQREQERLARKASQPPIQIGEQAQPVPQIAQQPQMDNQLLRQPDIIPLGNDRATGLQADPQQQPVQQTAQVLGNPQGVSVQPQQPIQPVQQTAQVLGNPQGVSVQPQQPIQPGQPVQ